MSELPSLDDHEWSNNEQTILLRHILARLELMDTSVLDLVALLGAWKAEWEHAHEWPPAIASLSLTIHVLQGVPMPAGLTIDTTNGLAVLAATDDHGDATSLPTGAVATFASDTDSVLTVGAAEATTDGAGNATISAPLTPVALGTANVSLASVTDANGNPLLEIDGVTPIPLPAAVEVTVSAGAADAFSLSVTG